MQKVKVAIVLGGFPSVSETFIALQVAELLRRGNEIYIYALGARGSREWLPDHIREHIDAANVRYLSDLSTSEFMFGLLIAALRRPRQLLAIFARRPRSTWVSLVREAIFFSDSDACDIAHFQFAPLAQRYLMATLPSTRPQTLLCSIRGFDVTKQNFVDSIDWNLLQSAGVFFVPVCKALQRRLRNLIPLSKSTVVYSPAAGIRANRSIEDSSGRPTTWKFVSIGRLVDKKGLHVSIASVDLLKRAGLLFSYEIFGSGPEEAALRNLVLSLGLDEQVRFMGSVPNDQAKTAIAKADMLLVPSCTPANGDSEGIPNVIKEGMLLGTTVVSTDHSGISELVEEPVTGYIAAEGDVNSFAETVSRAIENWDQNARLRQQAKSMVSENFSLEATTDSLERAYVEAQELATRRLS